MTQSFLPWWSILIAGFIAGVSVNNKPWYSWWGGFLGASLLWGIYAIYLNYLNHGILATKMGQLFGNLPSSVIILLTALVGGIYGGLGGVTGSNLRKLIYAPKQQV